MGHRVDRCMIADMEHMRPPLHHRAQPSGCGWVPCINQACWSGGARAVSTCHALALVLLNGRRPATRGRTSDMDQKWGAVAGEWKNPTTLRTSAALREGKRADVEVGCRRDRRLLGRRRILRTGRCVSFSDGWTLLWWPWTRQNRDG